MSPKSGRYRNEDKGERATPPLFEPAPTVRRNIERALKMMPRRFTLDQFVSQWRVWGDKAGRSDYDAGLLILQWLDFNERVEKDGLMHWRKVK